MFLKCLKYELLLLLMRCCYCCIVVVDWREWRTQLYWMCLMVLQRISED